MKSVNVTVDLDFYNYLLEIQEERTKAEERKPALSKILLEVAKRGRELSERYSAQHSALNGVQTDVQNSAHALDAKYLEIKERNLLKRLSDLDEWESELKQRESGLRELEREYLEKDVYNQFQQQDFDKIAEENVMLKRQNLNFQTKFQDLLNEYRLEVHKIKLMEEQHGKNYDRLLDHQRKNTQEVLSAIESLRNLQPKDWATLSAPFLAKLMDNFDISQLTQSPKPLGGVKKVSRIPQQKPRRNSKK